MRIQTESILKPAPHFNRREAVLDTLNDHAEGLHISHLSCQKVRHLCCKAALALCNGSPVFVFGVLFGAEPVGDHDSDEAAATELMQVFSDVHAAESLLGAGPDDTIQSMLDCRISYEKTGDGGWQPLGSRAIRRKLDAAALDRAHKITG